MRSRHIEAAPSGAFLTKPLLSRNLWNRRRISPSPRTKGVLCVTYTVFNFQRAPTPEGAFPALAETSPIARNRLLQLPVRTTDNLPPRRLPRRRWDPRPQPGESFHLPKAYINTTRAACQPASFGGLSSRATCLRLSAVAKRIFTIARKRPIVKNFLIPHPQVYRTTYRNRTASGNEKRRKAEASIIPRQCHPFRDGLTLCEAVAWPPIRSGGS